MIEIINDNLSYYKTPKSKELLLTYINTNNDILSNKDYIIDTFCAKMKFNKIDFTIIDNKFEFKLIPIEEKINKQLLRNKITHLKRNRAKRPQIKTNYKNINKNIINLYETAIINYNKGAEIPHPNDVMANFDKYKLSFYNYLIEIYNGNFNQDEMDVLLHNDYTKYMSAICCISID